MTITVVNKRNIQHLADIVKRDSDNICTTIYVARGSALGNPFPIGTTRTRDTVCDEYKTWFDAQIRVGNSAMERELHNIRAAAQKGDVHLVCYCAPKRCHADYIKQIVEETL